MTTLSQILFWLGIVSIPLSWVMWWFGPTVEIVRHSASKVADPVLRDALLEAHAERWGLFIATWPATLLVLSYIVGQYK